MSLIQKKIISDRFANTYQFFTNFKRMWNTMECKRDTDIFHHDGSFHDGSFSKDALPINFLDI